MFQNCLKSDTLQLLLLILFVSVTFLYSYNITVIKIIPSFGWVPASNSTHSLSSQPPSRRISSGKTFLVHLFSSGKREVNCAIVTSFRHRFKYNVMDGGFVRWLELQKEWEANCMHVELLPFFRSLYHPPILLVVRCPATAAASLHRMQPNQILCKLNFNKSQRIRSKR